MEYLNMKKFLSFMAVLALCACSGFVKPEQGSDKIVKIEGEPIGCAFLYRLETEVSVYDHEDAEQYLRNRIVDQQRRGNAYWIISQRTRPNEWVVFGPERSFIIGANVYDCPDTRNIEVR